MHSVYRMREGDTSVYGTFRCDVLGERLNVTIDRLEDGDVRALDILGVPIHRGDVATHISGRGNFSDSTHAVGWVREIGWHTAARVDGKPVQSTIRDPEAVVIVAHFHDPEWTKPHMALFTSAAHFVTMRGLAMVFSGCRAFTPADVCARIDAAREDEHGRKALFPMLGDRQHERAVRRLLEQSVGSGPWRLERCGRWSYRFAATVVVCEAEQRGEG